jgi:hypothetical protein
MKAFLRWGLSASLAVLLPAASAPATQSLDPVTVTARVPLQKEAVHELREARYGAAAVSLGGFIYVIGGSNESGTPLDSIERFDPRTGRSEIFGKLRVARRHHRAVVVAGKIYVLGGDSHLPVRAEDLNGVPIIDGPPPDDGFVEALTRADGERARDRSGDFIVLPQRAALSPLENTVEVIDPVTRGVDLAPAMPIAKASFSCATIGDKIYVIGGLQMRGGRLFTTNSTEIFDPASGRWSAGVNMPGPRAAQAVVVDDFIVVAGGVRREFGLVAVESFFPAGRVWRQLPPLHEPVNPTAAVFFGHEIYLFGADGARNKLIAYDLMKKTSRAFPLPYEHVQYAATVVHSGKIYMLGGAVLQGRVASRSIQVFSPPAAPDRKG